TRTWDLQLRKSLLGSRTLPFAETALGAALSSRARCDRSASEISNSPFRKCLQFGLVRLCARSAKYKALEKTGPSEDRTRGPPPSRWYLPKCWQDKPKLSAPVPAEKGGALDQWRSEWCLNPTFSTAQAVLYGRHGPAIR